MASISGRGAQVRLAGPAQQAARGRAGTSTDANTLIKRNLEAAGLSADGTTVDGSTLTGVAAVDEVEASGAALVGAFALTDAASIVTDALNGNFFTVTLGGNRTLANPTNLVPGVRYVWRVTQDGTGSRTLAYGANFKWAGGSAPTVTATANAVSIIAAETDGTLLYGTSILAVA